MLDELLINEIQKRPVLYNTKLKQYKNNAHRKHLWNEVANATGSSSVLCQTRWKRLREQYVKWKANKPKSGSAGIKKETPAILKTMEFLSPYIIDDNSLLASSINIVDSVVTEDCEAFPTSLSSFLSDYTPYTENASTEQSENVLRETGNIQKIPKTARNIGGKSGSSDIEKIIEAINTPIEEHGGVEHYCLSIAEDMRNMEPAEQRRVKMEIGIILANAKYKN